jgi:uncharacterized protein
MFKERELLKQIQTYFYSSEAVLITGMRRTGKTTLLENIYSKIDSKNKLLLDFENPINRKYFEDENYEKIKSSLEILGLDFESKVYLFLDEIQFLRNISSVIKYFIDTWKVKFFMTGSTNFYSRKLFDESLAGRKVIFELFPLTFREFLNFKGKKINPPSQSTAVSKPIFDMLANYYDEYYMFGGFPEVVLKKTIEEKKKCLEDIFASFFKFEIVQLSNYRKSEVIRDLMLLLMRKTGSRLDVQKISLELNISRATTYEYLAFLEGSYFVKTILPYTVQSDIEIRKSPKIYICDSGLVNHFARTTEECLFENSVFQNLRTKGKVQYYERKSGSSISFILNNETAYDVELHPRKSDLTRIQRLSADLFLKNYYVVSKNYSELESIQYSFMV